MSIICFVTMMTIREKKNTRKKIIQRFNVFQQTFLKSLKCPGFFLLASNLISAPPHCHSRRSHTQSQSSFIALSTLWPHHPRRSHDLYQELLPRSNREQLPGTDLAGGQWGTHP